MNKSDKLKIYQTVLEKIRDSLPCDKAAHFYGNKLCYSCIAERALKGISKPWEPSEERDAPFKLDEMPVGCYYAIVSGYHDYYGVGFKIVSTTTKVNLEAKSPWDVLPKESIQVYCKQMPASLVVAGSILEIEILKKGGYKIIRKIR